MVVAYCSWASVEVLMYTTRLTEYVLKIEGFLRFDIVKTLLTISEGSTLSINNPTQLPLILRGIDNTDGELGSDSHVTTPVVVKVLMVY